MAPILFSSFIPGHFQCDFVVLPDKDLKSISQPLDFTLDHMTSFGQWKDSRTYVCKVQTNSFITVLTLLQMLLS